MPVKIRLARRGRKKRALYDVVVADSRSSRDGRFIEKIGTYDPNSNPAHIELNEEKAFSWVMNGALPTDTVKAMLSYRGILLKKHLQIGVNKGAITQEEADKRFAEWINSKDSKIQGKKDTLAKSKEDKAKAKLEAETKKNKARQDALLAKKKEAEAALTAQVAAASATEAEQALVEEGETAVEQPQASAEQSEETQA